MSARIGLRPQAPLTPQDLGVDSSPSGHNGGLVVVGSYVPKTTKQVNLLQSLHSYTALTAVLTS